MYKLGFANRVVDALSRILAQSTLMSLSVPSVVKMVELDKDLALDPTISQIRHALSQEQPTKPRYSLIQGRVYYRGKLVLPPTSKFIPLILHEYHENPIEGHSGVLKTLKSVSTVFYWPRMNTPSNLMSLPVRCARKINTPPYHPEDCYSLFLFHNRFGRIFN